MKKSLRLLTALLSLATLALSTGSAWAYTTAANTQILNTATLTFAGGSASASVTVVVGLIPTKPTIDITNGTANYTGTNTQTIPDTVTITSNANGPALYSVSALVTAVTNTDLALNQAVAVVGTNPVMIGATITNAGSAWGTLSVPSDGTADSFVNNIHAGSTIVFTVGTQTYTKNVNTVADPGSTGTATITFPTIAGEPLTVPAGTPVYEQVPVNVTVLPGTVASSGAELTVTVRATVATPGVSDVSVTNHAANVWTTPNISVHITKYVRNATADAASVASTFGAPTGTTFTVNGQSHPYYVSTPTSGVTAKPGEELEYIVVARNVTDTVIVPPSLAPVPVAISGSFISDTLPTAYVTFGYGKIGGKDVWLFPTDPSSLGVLYNVAEVGTYAAPTLRVNVGDGAGAGITTGSIPAGKSVKIVYRAVVN